VEGKAMNQLDPVANPFALMMDPEAVFRAIERSERLSLLKSRICRPLDKPMLQGAAASTADESDSATDEPGDITTN
jgi:hypothetical protein